MDSQEVVTTQQTAKRFKAIMLAGILGMLLAAMLALLGLANVEDDTRAMTFVYAAGYLAAASLMVYASGRGLAWWHHG